MMAQTEYDKRVEHNTRIAQEAYNKSGQDGLLGIMGKIYTYDSLPGELHINTLMRNAFDIIPSLLLGYLPRVTKDGADGIEMVIGEEIELEYKWATFEAWRIWKSPKGTLYVGKADFPYSRRSSLTGSIAGMFTISSASCLKSKKRKTILLVSDTTNLNHIIIDVFEMDSGTVLEYLSDTNGHGKKRTTANRNIKLRSFINEGHSIKSKSWADDGMRWGEYEEYIRQNTLLFKDWIIENPQNE